MKGSEECYSGNSVTVSAGTHGRTERYRGCAISQDIDISLHTLDAAWMSCPDVGTATCCTHDIEQLDIARPSPMDTIPWLALGRQTDRAVLLSPSRPVLYLSNTHV